MGQPASMRGHAGQVGIFGIGGDDVAHDDVAHGIGGDTGAGNGGPDHGGGQLGVGHVFQAAAKGADGGAGGADDEDVADGHGFSLGVGMRPMFSPRIAPGRLAKKAATPSLKSGVLAQARKACASACNCGRQIARQAVT